MKKKLLKITFLGSGLGLLAWAVWFVISTAKASQYAASGIVGGADTPTVLFLTSRLWQSPQGIILAALILLYLISGILLILKGRKHEEK